MSIYRQVQVQAPRVSTLGLVCGTVVFLAAWASTATAQTTQAEDRSDGAIEEIAVVGYRNSLKASLGVKRNENGVVDAIVAEDIADFPDILFEHPMGRGIGNH